MDITKEQLEELYIEQKMSIRGCAKILGFPTHSGVSRLLKKFNIPTRPSGFQVGNRTPGDRTPESHGCWKGGKKTVQCSFCNKDIHRFPSLIHEDNFCNHECHGKWRIENFKGEGNPNHGSIAMFGDANPNWRGGIACGEYCDSWNDKEFKNYIKERDEHTCQNITCWQGGSSLTIHHIDYDKKNCHPKNLITLCVSCNARANYERKAWEEFYKIIMFDKYKEIETAGQTIPA